MYVWICILVLMVSTQAVYSPLPPKVKSVFVGAIFEHDSEETLSAFKFAVRQHNRGHGGKQFILRPFIDQLDISNSYNLTATLCRRMEQGIFAFFGLKNMTSVNVIHSLSERSTMPFISPNISPVTSSRTSHYEIHMMPPYTDAIIDLIVYYQWTKIHYMYDSDEGLHRLDAMYRTSQLYTHVRSIVPWRIRDPYNMHADLRRMDFSDKMPRCRDINNRRNIVVDFSNIRFYKILIKQMSEVGMNKCGYHYLFTAPGFRELDVETLRYGGVNLTGLQLLDKNSKHIRYFSNKWKDLSSIQWPGAGTPTVSYPVALMVDAVSVFTKAIQNSEGLKFRRGELYNNESRGAPCQDIPVKWVYGPSIVREMKKIAFNGLSGKVAFDERGYRKNFRLDILEFGLNYGPAKLTTWSPSHRLTSQKDYGVGDTRSDDTKNTTIEIISVLTPPYLMKKKKDKNGAPLTGNNLYEGFCAELAEEIVERGKFQDYILRPVIDGKHGEMVNGTTWNGIIGELINRTADLGIADLTITTEREKVVDFSKPFMDVGISIMIKKPEAQKPGVFSFMDPLSNKIWMCIICAYVIVSLSLFFVTRLSPYERKSTHQEDGDEEFGLTCSMWFALGALMQQGGDVFPRTPAGRVIGSVWWFFTLIVISSYTANLAAFLTIEHMVTPINSAKELAEQEEIAYGTLNSGSTKNFFRKSNQSDYKNMWEYMNNKKSVFVDSTEEGITRVINSNGKYAFLLESTTNDFTNNRNPCKTMKVGPNLDSKNFGIATPTGSELREAVSMMVLTMMEKGILRKLKKRWWYDKGECGQQDEGTTSKDSITKALSLENMAGIFYILIGGLTLSMVVGMVELHIKSKRIIMKKRNMGTILSTDSRDTSVTSLRKSHSGRRYSGYHTDHNSYHTDHSDTEYGPPHTSDYVNYPPQSDAAASNYPYSHSSQRMIGFEPIAAEINTQTQV